MEVLFKQTNLRVGQTYEATANDNGAICGICENGQMLGVKPAEFEFVSLPEWLFDIWAIDFPYSVEHATIESLPVVVPAERREG